MAFIGAQYFEETLVTNYDLSNGISAFTSSNLIQFRDASIQISHVNVNDQPLICVDHSHDNTNWDCIYEELLPVGTDSLTIERTNFTGKFLRFRIKDTNGEGTVSVNLIAK